MSQQTAAGSAPGIFKGLLLLAVANIRRDRLRTALLLLTIALATLLFITSLASMAGIQAPVEAMMERQKASHLLINFDTRVYPPSSIVGWFLQHERVEGVSPLMPNVLSNGRPTLDGKPFGDTLRLTERPLGKMQIDLLNFMEGEERPYPAPGEIWLPTSTAKSGGIQIGDVIEIPTDEGAARYIASAIVVDPQYSSGFNNPVRAWIAPGELAAIFTPGKLQNYQFGVRLKNGAEQEAIWKDFSAGFDGGFTGGHITYQGTVNSYSNMLRIMAAMVLVFGLMSLAVALFIISSTISGVILASYRTFGVLKSLGYTPGNVGLIFQIQFILMSLVAVPLGIVGGWLLSKLLIAVMLDSIGSIDAAPVMTPLVKWRCKNGYTRMMGMIVTTVLKPCMYSTHQVHNS